MGANPPLTINNHQKGDDAPSSRRLPACPTQKIVDTYHDALPDNPRVKVLNVARRNAIAARWKEAAKLNCKPFGYQTQTEGIAAWSRFFAVCAQSAFLTGRAPPQPGRRQFAADIDFLMSPSGFAKTLENRYHEGGE